MQHFFRVIPLPSLVHGCNRSLKRKPRATVGKLSSQWVIVAAQ